MTVRNPHRPWWLGIAHEVVERSRLCEQIAERIGRSREALRLRWAARHACARLRGELATTREREAKLRHTLVLIYHAINDCRVHWDVPNHMCLVVIEEALAFGKDQPK